jgi:hypothetical protein
LLYLSSLALSPSAAANRRIGLVNFKPEITPLPIPTNFAPLPTRHLDAHHRGLKPENFGCLQLLWPDKNGHFPMDADCDAEVRRIQTPVNSALC